MNLGGKINTLCLLIYILYFRKQKQSGYFYIFVNNKKTIKMCENVIYVFVLHIVIHKKIHKINIQIIGALLQNIYHNFCGSETEIEQFQFLKSFHLRSFLYRGGHRISTKFCIFLSQSLHGYYFRQIWRPLVFIDFPWWTTFPNSNWNCRTPSGSWSFDMKCLPTLHPVEFGSVWKV